MTWTKNLSLENFCCKNLLFSKSRRGVASLPRGLGQKGAEEKIVPAEGNV